MNYHERKYRRMVRRQRAALLARAALIAAAWLGVVVAFVLMAGRL